MRKLLLSGVPLAVLAGPAFAADLPSTKDAPVFVAPSPIFNWTGFYAGANAGYGWGPAKARLQLPADPGSQSFFNPALAAGALPATLNFNRSGFIGGGQIGYNYQINSVVLGLEADIQGADVGGSSALTTINTPGFVAGNYSARSTLDWLGTVRGRLGFTPVERWLVYATGGLAYGHSNRSYSAVAPMSNDFFSSSRSSTNVGWTLGAGVEWAVNNNWSIKAEYIHYCLSCSTDITTPGGRDLALVAAGFTQPLANKFSNGGDIVRVGLNYRFDAPTAPQIVAKY